MGLLSFLFGQPRRRAPQLTEWTGTAPVVIAPPTSGPLALRPGGVVSYDGTDFIVTGRQVCSAHGVEWYALHLEDTSSGRDIWLDLEDDDGLQLAVSEPLELSIPEPVPLRLNWEGHSYRLDEHGYARVLIESTSTPAHYVQIEYWDFYTSGSTLSLGVEKWGNQLEASLSRPIQPYELQILSAGPPDA
jgi:hypothetical protein